MHRRHHKTDFLEWTRVLAAVGIVMWCPNGHAAGARSENDKKACVSAADEGQLLRDSGRYIEALWQFTNCADEICPSLVREQCAAWSEQTVNATPTVVFAVADERGGDISEVRVVAEGRVLLEHLDGRPIALDPGKHEFRFEAPNRRDVTVSVLLGVGEKNRRITAVFVDFQTAPAHIAPAPRLLFEPPSPSPLPSQSPSALPSQSPSPLPSQSPSALPSQRRDAPLDGRFVATLALLTSGALSVGGGIVLSVLSQHDAAEAADVRRSMTSSTCAQPGPPLLCARLSQEVAAQRRDATASAVFYAGGAALAAAGGALWILLQGAPKRSGGTAAIFVHPLFGMRSAGLTAEMALP